MNTLSTILMSPAIAFPVMVVAVAVLAAALTLLSHRRKGRQGLEPYACGEDMPDHMIQPDYGQFMPFAFFFTILHVVALMVTTVPVETMTSFLIALVYIGGAGIGLIVLYRK